MTLGTLESRTGRDPTGKRQKFVELKKMSRISDKKDTLGSAFRKIDVDQYNENDFKEEDADGGTTAPTGPDENEVMTLLSQYPLQTYLFLV